MPSESDVFGSAGAKPDGAAGASASGGALGEAGMLGDSGSADNGGAEPSAGAAGVGNSGSSGSNGVSGAPGASGSLGVSGAPGASGSLGFDAGAGLVAHFTFDEPSGAVAANAKDSRKNAKCVGTCTHPEGQLGLAIGIRNNVSPTDWIELPASIFSGFSAITLSVWLRDLSTTRNDAPLFHFSATDEDALFFLPDDRNAQTDAAGAHLSGLRAGSSFVDLWSETPVLTDKVWHQLAMSWNAASIELYIDGKSVASKRNPTMLPAHLAAATRNYLGRARNDSSFAFYGEIDDLRLYDRVLSAAQVALLYNFR